jgi:hypothetical protein
MIALNPDDPLRTFLDVALPPMREREKERHNIHLLLSLALVWDNWCIAKDNPNAAKAYRRLEPGREWSEYVGHNIGALSARESVTTTGSSGSPGRASRATPPSSKGTRCTRRSSPARSAPG